MNKQPIYKKKQSIIRSNQDMILDLLNYKIDSNLYTNCPAETYQDLIDFGGRKKLSQHDLCSENCLIIAITASDIEKTGYKTEDILLGIEQLLYAKPPVVSLLFVTKPEKSSKIRDEIIRQNLYKEIEMPVGGKRIKVMSKIEPVFYFDHPIFLVAVNNNFESDYKKTYSSNSENYCKPWKNIELEKITFVYKKDSIAGWYPNDDLSCGQLSQVCHKCSKNIQKWL